MHGRQKKNKKKAAINYRLVLFSRGPVDARFLYTYTIFFFFFPAEFEFKTQANPADTIFVLLIFDTR